MAKSSLILIAVTVATAILLLPSTTTATRPCKTLYISTFSIATIPLKNPNKIHLRFPHYVTVYSEISQFNNPIPTKFTRSLPFDHFYPQNHQSPNDYDFTYLRDRTKDILSVVVALLFGVGCGALTAATMYLAWSLFSARSLSAGYYLDEGGEYDDIPSPKKMGYVSVPSVDEKKADTKPVE